MEDVACAICGKKSEKPWVIVKDGTYGIPGEFTLIKCSFCGLVYLSPRPTQKEMEAYYPKDYIPHIRSVSGIEGMFPVAGKIFYLGKRFFLGYDPLLGFLKKGTALEIGCGSGLYLKSLMQKGWEAYGVDVSPLAVQYAKQLGIRVHLGELTEAQFKDGFFGVVLCMGALGHIHNPSALLREVRRIIRGDGYLIVTLPNIAGIEARIFKEAYWNGKDIPRQLYFFTPETLENLLRKNGFYVKRKFFFGFISSRSLYIALPYHMKKTWYAHVLNNHLIYYLTAVLTYPLMVLASKIFHKGPLMAIHAVIGPLDE